MAVDTCRCWRQSTQSTSYPSTRRSPGSAHPLPTLHRRATSPRHLVVNFHSSVCVLVVDGVIAAAAKLPGKQYAADPRSSHLLKDNADELAPFVTELFNRSLCQLECFRRSSRQHSSPRYWRSQISNGPKGNHSGPYQASLFVKTLKRLVARQLIGHLSEWKLFPERQTALRAHHSTETTVLWVLSDVFEALDRGDLARYCLTAAFDMDHTTLRINFGKKSPPLKSSLVLTLLTKNNS